MEAALSDRDEGILSRARSLLGRVASTVRAVLPGTPDERRSSPPPAPDAGSGSAGAGSHSPERALPALPAAALARLADPSFVGVALLREPSLVVVWRVTEAAIARAQRIAPPGAEMHVRVSRIGWPQGADAPRVHHEDHGAVRSEGALALPQSAPGEQILAAVGLQAADGAFVAIEHGRL